jgi:hypothetical protein
MVLVLCRQPSHQSVKGSQEEKIEDGHRVGIGATSQHDESTSERMESQCGFGGRAIPNRESVDYASEKR